MVLDTVTSKGLAIRLRSMTEADWDVLYRWNNDPDVLYWTEEDKVSSRTLEEIKEIYCSVCAQAFCFIIEIKGKPIGECWLQKMNLDEILEKHPGKDLRRIDLMIGEKSFWGKGVGTAVIGALTEFGFIRKDADVIFGCSVADNNPRSLRAFEKAGYVLYSKEKSVSPKYDYHFHFYETREEFLKRRLGPQAL